MVATAQVEGVVQQSIEASAGHSEWTQHAVVAVAPVTASDQVATGSPPPLIAGWQGMLSGLPAESAQGPEAGLWAAAGGLQCSPATALMQPDLEEWVAQRLGSGRNMYLQTGQLEIRQTKSHLYQKT